MTAEQGRLLLPETLPPTPVACILMLKYIDNKPYILITKRARNPEKKQYTLPGGRIETGENPVQCASRELHEETGLTVFNEDLLISAQKNPW